MGEFDLAVREQVLLREALIGPTGSGKTHAALRQAVEVADSIEDVFVIDAENGRARLEVDNFGQFPHKVLTPNEKTPEGYVGATNRAFAAGAQVVVLDSVTPEWKAVLGEVDRRFGNWKDVRPKHDDWIASLINAPGHLIVTIRAKMKYSVQEVERDGGGTRQQIEALGMGPIQDENLPYEFDVVGYIDRSHMITFSNRCRPLEGKSMTIDEAAPIVKEWLAEGVAPEPPEMAASERVERLYELALERSTMNTREEIDAFLADAKARNRGALHPDYVEQQIGRLEKLPVPAAKDDKPKTET